MAAHVHPESPITRDHYVGFGMVIHQFALVDSILEEAIREMLGLERYQATFLMPQFRHEQKRNMFLSLLDETNIKECKAKKIEKIIGKIAVKSRLRNHVAHSVWTRGRRPNSIKPMSITVRGKIKYLGFDHNEKEWTPEELEQAAIEIGRIYDELKAFIEAGGDFQHSDREGS